MPVGRQLVVRPDELRRVIQLRDMLAAHIRPESLDDWRFKAFDRDALFPDEIARFFGVDASEARAVLGRDSVAKDDLWYLAVAGTRAGKKAISEAKAHIAARRQRHVVTPAMRLQILARDSGLCRYCGRRVDKLYTI